ncbi:rhomboid family intramembrane serine protease [Halobaculum marinum]|uniref:Rhomboid family intramembrane serine protease n=1 Tax=Halobaculum marinum TaxID=3031996 RepID=A0ABD5WW04_9EURY|nr:rhomboid family intramembrane serine protease [Halobaculum sp. DT55]
MQSDRAVDAPDDLPAFLGRLRDQYRAAHTGTTLTLVALTSAVFLLQLVGTALTGADSVRQLTAYLFLEGGDAVYLLSLFLHRGPLHFLSNVLVLLVLAPQERHFSPGGYWTFVATAAVASLATGYAVLLAYSPQPNVAFYGISGLGYALAGFALARGVRFRDGLSELDLVAAAVGVTSTVAVAANLLVSLPDAPVAVNGGHLAGVVVGLATGAVWRRRSGVDAAAESSADDAQ